LERTWIFAPFKGASSSHRLCRWSLTLNLTGFQLHTILELGDGDFREARKYAGRHDMFFYEMYAALRYVPHETWRDFMVFITADEDME
jgi:hypothetical protein